ncbi:hypothetical protein [Myxosarcina sp. GI1]|uniref:hypothetical protein n=1 Tax=Myxosarcina sp. GI1 TaxID=1541065 RepID=UPI00055F8E48|nr:hypothetical protein [Myxosarcina sp. GI1]
MLRKIVAILISLSLCCTLVGCGTANSAQTQPVFNKSSDLASTPTSIVDGTYPVQQATYDDATGEYSLMLLNTPPGTSPVLKTDKLQMARLSDEEITNGKKTYLQVDRGQPVMYLSEDFKIEYVHNVTETVSNPQTGQPETVVVRRESNFWTPFAGALAGQAIGSLLFTPHYYVPPVYQSGGIITGYGGYGRSYSQAVNSYRDRYNAPPAAVQNRRTLRTTGSIRNASGNRNTFGSKANNNSRATGSGVGSSTLRSSGKSSSKQYQRPSSFGSSSRSRMRTRTRSFSRRRR